MNIVISYFVEGNERLIYEERFKDKANLIFLKDIAKENRTKVLAKSDVILTWNVPRELAAVEKELFEHLRFVQLLSAGYDHLNFNMFPADCLIAANQGAYAEPMAEHTIAMILNLTKRLLINHAKMKHGEFDQNTESRILKNSVIGIIGFGSIGKAVANLLRNFGVRIFAINTSGTTDEDIEFIGTMKDLDYVLNNSDTVLISIPLNDKTRNLINKQKLELMKPNAILINVARADIINEEDLFNHLKSHPDFLAGIDAWWIEPFRFGEFRLNFPFLDLPNVLGSPHNSAVATNSLLEGHKRAVENVLRFLDGKQVEGIIYRN
jgi:phosphoglycerate dehydrogenase-like enzyme